MESELKVHLSPAVLSFLLYDACNSVAEFEGILYGSISTRSSMLCSDAISSDQTVLMTRDVNIERFVNCGPAHSFYDRRLALRMDFIEKLSAKILDERPNYGPLGWFRFRRQSMLPNRSRLEHVVSRQLCDVESLTENFCREGVLFFLITEEPLAAGEQKNCGEISYQLFRYSLDWKTFTRVPIELMSGVATGCAEYSQRSLSFGPRVVGQPHSFLELINVSTAYVGSTKAITQCYVNELNAKREQLAKSADFTTACSDVSESTIRDAVRKSLLYNYCPLDRQMANETVPWLLNPKLLPQAISVKEKVGVAGSITRNSFTMSGQDENSYSRGSCYYTADYNNFF
ncbi:hypothetical protein D918_00721 [Trichuris suis]|nr:hypothetical protein D918_00721 [Trichuris suis]